MRPRLALGAAGGLLALFGVFRLVTEVPLSALAVLALWLAGAILIHDGILSPAVLAVGLALRRVPARARRYLQAGLIVGGLITVVAIPLIYRRGSQPAAKTILDQNYGGNLTLLLGIIAALTLLGYAVRVARDRAG